MHNLVFLAEGRLGVVIDVNGVEYFIHPGIFFSYVIGLAIVIFCIVAGYKVKRANPHEKPTGIVFLAEFLVKGVDSFVENTLERKMPGLGPYILTLAMFVLLSNLSGLLGFVPPTSDYNVTLTLALITIVMAQYYGIRYTGIKRYVKGFFEPYVFMMPNNLLDLITTPMSMSLRLFGNILSGVIIMTLIYQATGYLALVVAPFFHGYFDVFTGVIQTFVFVLLTIVTIDGKL